MVNMSGDILVHLPHAAAFQIPGNISQTISDLDASFSVRLFPDGFSIGKGTERWKEPPSAQEVMDMMYPYNRTSESFLRALDGGCIPGDLLEDIPCKYVNGCVVCEILDYRTNAPSSADTLSSKSSMDWKPVVHKVTLRPTTESIVKDISSIVDETWTYRDLMEVESRILKTVWPSLNLDPKLTSKHTERNAMGISGHNIIKCCRTRKGALMDRRLRLAATAKATVKPGAPQSKLVQTRTGLTIPSAQFPPSPSSSMSGTPVTPLGHEPSGFAASNLRKRVSRDSEDVKLDIKRPKQMDTSALKFDNKSMTDQQHQDASNFQQHFDNENQHNAQPALGCLEQDPKVVSSADHESISEIMMNHPTEFQKSTKLEQQRLEDPVKIGEEHQNLETDELENQRLLQSFGKLQDLPSQSLQVLSPLGDRDRKQDDLLQRKKPPPSPKMLQKPDGRLSTQPSASELCQMSPMSVQNVVPALGSSTNPVIVPPLTSLNHPKQTQAAISGGPDPMLSLQQSTNSLLRRRANSLPKTPTMTPAVASPGSTVTSGGMQSINSPSTANMPPVTAVRSEASGQSKDPIENLMALLSVAQSHGLPAKKRKAEQLPDIKKTPPSWQLLLVALANPSSDDCKDPKRQRNMADSLVGGNVNVRKTRYLQFQRQIIQGPYLRRVRIRLVMCERGKDAMVEAVVQFGDDQDDEASNSVPHHVLPTMANAHAADLFAKQFCSLLEKDGFELVDDQVQPAMPRGNAPMNAASTARPMQAGASTLGNSMGQLPSPRAMPPMASVGGMTGMPPMQPASPSSALAPTRMPPPGNSSNRMAAGYLGQIGVGTFSKPLQLDGNTSQLTAAQHQQQHQQAHLQRAQQLVTPTQLAQLNATNHNSAQQINSQMVASQQFLQQQQHRHQSQTSAVLQRKLMGMGPMGNLGGVGIPVSGGTQGGLGNMVGLNGINNIVSMAGMNNVSASMGGISSLGNSGQFVAMGQNTGLGNLIGQPLRPGNLNAAHLAAISSKAHLMPGRGGRPVGTANSTARNPVDNFSGMNTSNQVHMSTSLPMIGGQSLSRVGRVGLTGLQRAPVTSMGSPKVPTSNMPTVPGQNFYLSSQQLSAQQQLNLQQLNPSNQPQLNTQQSQLPTPQVNLQLQQQPHSNPQQQLTPQQPKNSQPLNPQPSLNSPPQQQQMNPQSQINPASQQVNSQQLNNQQIVVGGLGSLVGGPGSPQLSSQNLGSVTGSSMDVQGSNGGASLPSCGQ